MAVTYYTQRASAVLIIAESTTPSPSGHCYVHQPGIYTKTQIDAWRRVTDSVHKAGGRIFLQLNHGGRAAHPLNQPSGGEEIIACRRRLLCAQRVIRNSSERRLHLCPAQ